MKWLISALTKAFLLYGLLLIVSYLFVRVQLITLSPVFIVFGILLFIAELHTIFHFFGMLYSLWPRKYQTYPEVNYDKNLQLNLYICVCGEPASLVRETVIAAKETTRKYVELVRPFSSPRVIVLNDGKAAGKENWQEIESLCYEQGVYHVAREIGGGFKAGNINNGLITFPTSDPHNTIDIIFDADFSALPEFLTEITKPFADHTVDFVQTPQRYKNEQTWVSKAAAAHQIYFFDWICEAKAHDNALFLCGTNFAIRREALLAVGGMDTRFITEDYSTSLNLHLAGKRGVFIKKVLALGVAPSSLKAYFNQQRRWAKGTFDASFAYLGKLLFGPLTWRQKFHYLLSATYYLIGVRDFLLMLAPLPFLFFGISLIRANSLTFLVGVYAPLLLFNLCLYFLLFKEPIKSLVLDIISFPVFVAAFLSSVTKKDLAFIVTIKQYEKENIFQVYKLQILVAAVLLSGLLFSFHRAITGVNPLGVYINYFWAAFNTCFLTLGFFLMLQDNYAKKLDDGLYVAEKTVRSVQMPWKYIAVPATFAALVIAIALFAMPSLHSVLSFQNTQLLVSAAQSAHTQEELLVPNTGSYYGYYQPELNAHPKKPTTSLIPGDHPSLAMYYQDWGEQAGFDSAFVANVASTGVVPVITWEPWSIKKANAGIIDQPEFYPKVIASGQYDDYIRTFAHEAAAYKKPVFIRFAHEMNGNWYPWGDLSGNTPADYIAMWRHVHDIFVAEGATNVLWVWSPNNTDSNGDSSSIMSYYPGDNYVDWVGFSGFNWGESGFGTTWTSFSDLAKNAYAILSTLNKPIMVTETSSVSEGGDKDAWFTDLFTKALPSMPNIKAVVLFHDDYKNADFSLKKGMHTDSVFRTNVLENTYYIKQPKLVERVEK